MSDTTPNKMREEFERIVNIDFLVSDFKMSNTDYPYYLNPNTNNLWLGWQAATFNMQAKINELETQLAEAKSAINNVFAARVDTTLK